MKSSEPFARSSELFIKSSGLFKRHQKMLFNIIIRHIKITAMDFDKKTQEGTMEPQDRMSRRVLRLPPEEERKKQPPDFRQRAVLV
jgi:hypothetical protein